MVKKKAKNPYLNQLEERNFGAFFFLDSFNLLPKNQNNCPLPHKLLQKYLLPAKIATIRGKIKSINPSQANKMLKKPKAK